MWILIAGPYSTGAPGHEQRARNLRTMNEAAVALLRAGHVPMIGVNVALPMIEVAGGDPLAFDEIMMPVSIALASAATPACALADRRRERTRKSRVF